METEIHMFRADMCVPPPPDQCVWRWVSAGTEQQLRCKPADWLMTCNMTGLTGYKILNELSLKSGPPCLRVLPPRPHPGYAEEDETR